MINDTWVIRWKEYLKDTYCYGSRIEFREDKSVVFINRLMPPGTVIHSWYSSTNFQRDKIEPSLPLIDGEGAYSITLNVDYSSDKSAPIILRIIFFDRYGAEADSIIIRNRIAFFKPSIKTYSYKIELINGGNADFTFKSIILKEISKEEFNAEQKRIEELKESTVKGKKMRRKDKKSK